MPICSNAPFIPRQKALRGLFLKPDRGMICTRLRTEDVLCCISSKTPPRKFPNSDIEQNNYVDFKHEAYRVNILRVGSDLY